MRRTAVAQPRQMDSHDKMMGMFFCFFFFQKITVNLNELFLDCVFILFFDPYHIEYEKYFFFLSRRRVLNSLPKQN